MFRPAFNTTFSGAALVFKSSTMCLLLLDMVYSWEYNVYATQELCSQDICRLSINRTLFMGFIDHAQTKMW